MNETCCAPCWTRHPCNRRGGALTEPVWPKAKTVTLKPCSAASTSSGMLQTWAMSACSAMVEPVDPTVP